jgi:predicted nucleotidyltransferase component of viral defense system
LAPSTLTPLQDELLRAFFEREDRFVLTGGAALGGFYLGHRKTKDLDLFATAPLLDEGERALRAAADALGCTVEETVTAPDFHRRIFKRGSQAVMVDLVHDRAPKSGIAPRLFGRVRVDDPLEILANKLCTLLGRSEPRDLIDVLALERAGFRLEDALPHAVKKDGGMSAAALSWILSTITFGDDVRLPPGFTPAELRAFLVDIQRRLTTLAFPRT